MLGVSDPWMLAILALFSVVVTIITSWIAGGVRRPSLPTAISVAGMVRLFASLVWCALLLVAGVIAVRYIERISHLAVGWLVFSVVACVLSLAHAHLLCRLQDEEIERFVRGICHNLVYLLGAVALYLLLLFAGDRSLSPLLLLPLSLGALLPDLDSRESLLGRLLPFFSQALEDHSGRCGKAHSLAANLLVAVITVPLISPAGWQAWALLSLGYLVHLIIVFA